MAMSYTPALELAHERLEALDSARVCARTGAMYQDGGYVMPWFGGAVPVADGSEPERIIWMHYLAGEGGKAPTGRLVAYRELSGAGFYEPAFNKRAVNPIAKRFGGDPAQLVAAGLALGGEAMQLGDGAVRLNMLPFVPVTYIVWRGDDEMPAAAAVLFDETASGWLVAEDLTVLASLGAYKLISC